MRILVLFLFSSCLWAQKNTQLNPVFPETHSVQKIKIPDPISEKPVNTEFMILKDSKNKVIGYARDINTDTGCNSACLPVIFTLHYNTKKEFIELTSKAGLTKKNHARFTPEDYFTLKTILLRNPKSFKTIKHPYEMVDMVSGATKKEYQPDVVKKAAYTSLRVNTYNQQTLGFLKSLNE